jgi:hypothetical protein
MYSAYASLVKALPVGDFCSVCLISASFEQAPSSASAENVTKNECRAFGARSSALFHFHCRFDIGPFLFGVDRWRRRPENRQGDDDDAEDRHG